MYYTINYLIGIIGHTSNLQHTHYNNSNIANIVTFATS